MTADVPTAAPPLDEAPPAAPLAPARPRGWARVGCAVVLALLGLLAGGIAFMLIRDFGSALLVNLRAGPEGRLPISGLERFSYEFLFSVVLILFIAALFALLPAFLYRSFEQTRRTRIRGDVWTDLMSLGYRMKLEQSAVATHKMRASEQALRSRDLRAQVVAAVWQGYSQTILPPAALPVNEEKVGPEDLALREFSQRFDENYGAQAFETPLAFVTVLYLVGWLIVLVPNALTGGHPGTGIGGLTILVKDGFKGYIPAVVSQLNLVSAAFLGAYLFSAQSLFRRYVSSDFKPTAISQAALRVITAWLVAFLLALVPVKALLPAADEATVSSWLKVLGFFSGLFSLEVLGGVWELTTKAFPWLQNRMRGTSELPNAELTDLDGVDNWHVDRLDEAGIRYVRGLATADFLDLLISVRMPTETLVDWVDQALLRMHVTRETWQAFQKTSLRTASDFLDAVGDEAQRTKLVAVLEAHKAADPPVLADQIDLLADALKRDPNIAYVTRFRLRQQQLVDSAT